MQTHSSHTLLIIWCYEKHQRDLFEELLKINLEYAEGIPGGLVMYLKKNKRDLIMLNDLIDLKNQRGLKLSMTRDY